MSELKESIRKDGQLQAILLMVHEAQYYIVGGHRRFKACFELGFEVIRADVNKSITMADMQRLALIENIQREQLQPLEIALAIEELINSDAYESKGALAKALGKTQTYVSKMLNILTLEKEIIAHLKANRFSIGLEVLNELQGIANPIAQVEWFYKYINDSIAVTDIRAFKKSLQTAVVVPTFKSTQNDKKYSVACNWKDWNPSKKDRFKKELIELMQRYES